MLARNILQKGSKMACWRIRKDPNAWLRLPYIYFKVPCLKEKLNPNNKRDKKDKRPVRAKRRAKVGISIKCPFWFNCNKM